MGRNMTKVNLLSHYDIFYFFPNYCYFCFCFDYYFCFGFLLLSGTRR
jgi:hypothetical protein